MLRTLCLAILTADLSLPAQAQPATATVAAPTARSGVLRGLARRIQPDLVGQSDRLPPYLEFFRRELANDSRLFAFDVSAVADAEDRVQLCGYVEFAETRTALESFLGILGFSVDNQIATLPADDLGDQTLGLVIASHSLSYDQPDGRRSVVTDCLLGEPVYLLREERGYLLVHSGEGYVGYIRSADVLRLDEPTFLSYVRAPTIRVHADCTAESGLAIPAGARLKCVAERDDMAIGELPAGEMVMLPRSCASIVRAPAVEVAPILENARRLIGTPYLWGGKTSAGVDCSGLVQVAFASAGIRLPRDANQQFVLGELTATRRHLGGLRRGDTLYFLGAHGRIRHTAIYLGDDRYLHAASPTVGVNSLNPAHEDFDAERRASFAFAKRILD